MANPQQPELRRSEENMRPRPDEGPDPQDVGGETGPVPPDNRPGHHPEHEQDKPPAEKFAAALGIKPDTEVGSVTPLPSPPRSSSDQDDSDEDTDETSAATEGSGTQADDGSRTSDGDEADEAAVETSVPPTLTPVTTAAATTFEAGSGPASAEPSAFPGPDAGGAAAASTMVAAAPAPEETPQEAAVLHHHALPDRDLPHAAGFVTPAGTPITGRAVLWPLQLWGTALKTTGSLICAYGNVVRKVGERIAPDRD